MTDHWHWPRQHGKSIVNKTLMEAMLRRGEHVHSASHLNGETCQGGDSECPLFELQLEEAITAWQG